MNDNLNHLIDLDHVPNHIAIIMDGNGRWAKKRHLPRIAGHKRGMNVVEKIAKDANSLGVKVLTLYAFSTENWKRPSKEVNYLMSLPTTFFNRFVPELVQNNVQVKAIGDLKHLPKSTYQAMIKAMEDTKNCDGMILNFAVNYGGHNEIVTAAQKIAKEVKNGQLNVSNINEECFEDHLMTNFLGPFSNPDLLIRTGGEKRISNFLLWQLAYSEFIFVDEYWPDFDKKSLVDCIHEFQHRNRRFGGLK
ncbi:ditrans,polycis-undecaprenyl-diphosphate synthase [Philodulcilactobacillus myokoensis]|uniref:Isoprenyl transferase n=1 Tax=Philodulcilactobacillus myokoensis TaxID=2929573 RepID=A0A9W6B1S2_9LACO|nr:isoprenyl transferase [Philodulcilactobacillus myokoensis]GLB46951.1 ditrans,polycis-undecaprenyl-diphosphate synthase [Philodulcilactobacillus myokoensis]